MATAAPEKSGVIPFDRAFKVSGLGRTRVGRPMPPAAVDEVAPDRFEPAPEVIDWIRNTFIKSAAPLFNPDHAHLEFAQLGVLWTNKSYRKQQRWIVGQAEDPKGGSMGAWKKGRGEQQLEEWFGTVPDFVITLYAPKLKTFDDRSFCAVIEHELYHCAQATTDTGAPRFSSITGEPLFAIKGHDVEQFYGVVARYGLDRETKALLELANNQPALPDQILEAACGTCQRMAA
jgi:hypothetical protein